MKKILMLGAALALVSGFALADSSSAPAGGPASDGVTQVKVDSDRAGPDREWKRHGQRHAGRDGEQGPRGPHHRGFGPPSPGAHIVLERGGSRIDVKCAEGDTTAQCVEAVKDLMNQVATTMRGDRPDAPPPAARPETPEPPAQ